ncbi:MAG: PadR family transcriptional regulator [Candidatus Micrarchaeota archaeon]|nr:PadR family transcriptional regulator [Candidatus Micrarchaeota archaeon]
MAIKITTLSRLALLLELSKGPAHGYALMKAVEQMTGAPCSPAQIYPFLTVLEKQKLVTRKAAAAGSRDKQPYALTPAGKKFVQNVLGKFGQILQLALAGQVTECAHCSCKIYGQAVWGKRDGLRLAYCCPHCAKHAGASIA